MESVQTPREPVMGRRSTFSGNSPASILDRIASHAANAPQHLALADGNARLTYAELERQSNQLASHLLEAGAALESCIGVFLDRSVQFVVAALAVMKTGAAYLPLDSSTPADRTSFILSDAAAPLLITQQAHARDLKLSGVRTIELDGPDAAQIAARSDSPVDVHLQPEHLAYVIYTSGSTGRPKGVEITHANLNNLIDWHNAAFAVTSADRASQVAGFGFDAAAWEIWPHLAAGASLFIADEVTRRSPIALRDWLVVNTITISFVPTVLAEQLLHESWPALTALRTLLTGADALHRRPSVGVPFTLINNYGPTECTVVTTSGVVAPDAKANSPSVPTIGRPITNATVLILDESLQPVAPGEPGELCIAGALVGPGYRNNPALTADRFVNFMSPSGGLMRIYRTGDRARILPNGEIAFLGRLDDQVKIRGYRIELGEIVATLDRCTAIEASAVGTVDGPGGPVLAAYIVAKKEGRLTSTDLREFLAGRLPDYMIPTHFVQIAAIPVTANGKLDRSALPAPTALNQLPSRAGTAPAAPANERQQRIAGLVANLLGQPSVQMDENFFMLGGHSMLGVQLVARIRDLFGVKLTLRQLFNAPTVAGLTAEVDRLSKAAS